MFPSPFKSSALSKIFKLELPSDEPTPPGPVCANDRVHKNGGVEGAGAVAELEGEEGVAVGGGLGGDFAQEERGGEGRAGVEGAEVTDGGKGGGGGHGEGDGGGRLF